MVEDWIDALTKTWGAISVNGTFGGGQVKSYNMITDDDFPDSINIDVLAQSPIALTFPPALSPLYSVGGPKLGYWAGMTEFHLAPDFAKSRLRSLLPWYTYIWNAAAGNANLNGKCDLFMLSTAPDAISTLMSLQYGDESKHWGLVVKWTVQEHVQNKITVGVQS